jgi:hypothetical protein
MALARAGSRALTSNLQGSTDGQCGGPAAEVDGDTRDANWRKIIE